VCQALAIENNKLSKAETRETKCEQVAFPHISETGWYTMFRVAQLKVDYGSLISFQLRGCVLLIMQQIGYFAYLW